MHNTRYFILYTTSAILYLEQQQMYAMRCTTVAPVEAGSRVGCQRQLPGTVEAADRDCAADGERVAADIEAEDYHRRSNVSMYSINSILPERVGVGEAPNSHYLIYFIQHHKLFN